MHNEIVIVHDRWMGRLIGLHQDILDYCYMVQHVPGYAPPHTAFDGIAYYSCVGACVSLRSVDRYDEIDRSFTRAGAPPTAEFQMVRKIKEYQNEWYFTPDAGA